LKHYGIICPPVRGHLNPSLAVARELQRRGHRVTVFHMPDLASSVRAEQVDFVTIGANDHPLGSLSQSLADLGRLSGFAALRFTVRAIAKTTEMICRDAPQAVRDARVDMLLVDQTEPAGGSVAEHLGIPFVTLCNALALNREPDVPPPFSPWNYRESMWARMRIENQRKVAMEILGTRHLAMKLWLHKLFVCVSILRYQPLGKSESILATLLA